MKRKLTILGLSLLAAGLIGLGPAAYFRFRQQTALASPPAMSSMSSESPAEPSAVDNPASVSGKPARLIIDQLDLQLAVADGAYDGSTRQWSLSTDKAHYAIMTAPSNNVSGNTFIYGHYRPEVFAKLRLLKPGYVAQIETGNGYRFSYTYRSTQTVNPADTSVLAYSGSPQLTLQTCSGLWMQNRQMYYFDFTRYEKI